MHAPARSWRPWARLGIGFATLAALTPALFRIGYPAIFSRWLPYDDEGYLLVSLRSYLGGYELYDQVFTQYGPFYFQVMGAIFDVGGTPPTHDGGRLITLGIWLMASGVAGLSAYLLTRRVLLAVGTQALTFLAMFTVTNEPMHPGALLCLLLVAMVAAIAATSRLPRTGWFVAGALAIAMTLVKVNVGGLALLALLVALIATRPVPFVVRVGGLAVLVLTPLALMAGDLVEPDVLAYAFVVASSGLGVAVMASVGALPQVSPNAGRWVSAGVGAASLGIVLVALLQGVSVSGLVQGVVVGPLGQREAFSIRLDVQPQLVIWAAIGMTMALVVAGFIARGSDWPLRSAPVLRIVAGLVMWFALSGLLGPSVPSFAVGLPVAWALLLPEAPARRGVILAAVALGVLEALHAYPVAGSQTSWSGLLLAPLGALAISDGIGRLAVNGPTRLRWVVRGAFLLPVAALLVWLVVGPLATLHEAVRAGYEGWPRPGLRGAERLRTDAVTARVYPRVVARLQTECSSFYSWPGLNSFYLFAGQDPPTLRNATHWMTIFDDELQREVVTDLRAQGDLCILRHRGLAAFWLQGRPEPEGPLTRYITERFVLHTAVADFELLVERSRGDARGLDSAPP